METLNPITRIKTYFSDETLMTKGEHRIRTIPPVIVVCVAIILIVGRLNSVAQAQADNVLEYAQGVAYAQCLSRVDTRESLREVLLNIADLFPESEGATAITVLINEEYPALDPLTTCTTPGS